MPEGGVRVSRHRYWTVTEQRTLHLLWTKGVPVADIAAVLDRPIGGVHGQVRRMGLEPRIGRPSLTQMTTDIDDEVSALCAPIICAHPGGTR